MPRTLLSRIALPATVLALTSAAWAAVGCGFRRPLTGFHPQSFSASRLRRSGGQRARGGVAARLRPPPAARARWRPGETIDCVPDGSVDGAPVADVDARSPPGGQVLDGTTAPDGRITFEGIDWSLGSASSTFSSRTRATASSTSTRPGCGRAPPAAFVRPALADPPENVEVRRRCAEPR